MKRTVAIALTLLSGGALLAQKQDSAPAQRVMDSESYVRRFSAGATLSVLGLTLIPGNTSNSVTTNPPVDSLYTTTNGSQRIGYGATAQVLITNRFAVNAGFFLRRIGYKMTSDILEGNPVSTHTVINEDTRARLYDVPVVLRFYGKDRYESGARWFVEAGGAIRRVSHIKTSIDTTVNDGTTSCCNVTPATPAHQTARGLVAGFGVQVTDPIGIRVVPEVRYTRWLNQTFNSFSTAMRRDQVEGMISLTF
jgi:hypothetical protein